MIREDSPEERGSQIWEGFVKRWVLSQQWVRKRHLMNVSTMWNVLCFAAKSHSTRYDGFQRVNRNSYSTLRWWESLACLHYIIVCGGRATGWCKNWAVGWDRKVADISHGSVATRLRPVEIFNDNHYRLSDKCDGKRIFEIPQYLVKLWVRMFSGIFVTQYCFFAPHCIMRDTVTYSCAVLVLLFCSQYSHFYVC